ncbi:MAG: hypothetical protein JWQ49_566 [Edaphobacter sp.]|nr:hypothetical protein [Edaphobacter sp.]
MLHRPVELARLFRNYEGACSIRAANKMRADGCALPNSAEATKTETPSCARIFLKTPWVSRAKVSSGTTLIIIKAH